MHTHRQCFDASHIDRKLDDLLVMPIVRGNEMVGEQLPPLALFLDLSVHVDHGQRTWSIGIALDLFNFQLQRPRRVQRLTFLERQRSHASASLRRFGSFSELYGLSGRADPRLRPCLNGFMVVWCCMVSCMESGYFPTGLVPASGEMVKVELRCGTEVWGKSEDKGRKSEVTFQLTRPVVLATGKLR